MNNKTYVVFIDCWDQFNHLSWVGLEPGVNFYDNMIKTLAKFDFDQFIFHTTFLSLDIMTQDVVHYFKSQVVQATTLAEQQQNIQDYVSMLGTETLCIQLHELANGSNSIFIPTIRGLEEYTRQTGLHKLVIVGSTWPLCTHTKNLGFNNLVKMIQENQPWLQVYSIPSCTAAWHQNTDGVDSIDGMFSDGEQILRVCTDDDYVNDTLSWKKVEDDLWRLQP